MNPGRRRQASLPWAKVSQAFSLKAENARIVDKFSTNNPEVDTLGIENPDGHALRRYKWQS